MKKQTHKKHSHRKLPRSGVYLRAPKGFGIEVENEGYGDEQGPFEVHLVRKFKTVPNRRIGSVSLEFADYRRKTLETHSHLQGRYRGKHLGSFMYASAIKYALDHGFKIHSSGMSSGMAIRVWQGKYLRRRFKITKINDGGGWGDSPTWSAKAKKDEKHKTARR